MGRMADIWKTVEGGPITPLPTPGALLTLDAVSPPTAIFEPAEDDDVPFIEVGGPRPVMRHLEPLAPKSEPAIVPPAPPTIPADTIMSVRFGAVHAAGSLPAGFGSEIIAFHQPDHNVSIQYRSLVAEMAAQLPGTKPRAVLVTASAAGVGATTVVLNLSVTLARQDGVRVTVVDADIERPELAARLRISTTPGMRDVIARGNPPAWSVQETGQPQLFALPAHRDDAPAGQALAPIIEQLRSRNDWVIIDAGVWHPQLVPLAAACDAIYLVHADTDPASADAIQAIVTATGRLRGCFITRR